MNVEVNNTDLNLDSTHLEDGKPGHELTTVITYDEIT